MNAAMALGDRSSAYPILHKVVIRTAYSPEDDAGGSVVTAPSTINTVFNMCIFLRYLTYLNLFLATLTQETGNPTFLNYIFL